MAVPVDIHNAFLSAIREAFNAACPDIPLCRQKVDEVFREMKEFAGEKDAETDLWRLSMLAFDLGLELDFKLVKR